MSSTNDITGDYLVNKKTTDAYRDNYDKIFGKSRRKEEHRQAVQDDEFLRYVDVTLSQEQQAAVDDTAGIEKENTNDR